MATKRTAARAALYDPATLYDVTLGRVVQHEGFAYRPDPSLTMTGELLNALSVDHADAILAAAPMAPPAPLPPIEAQDHKCAGDVHRHRCPAGTVTVISAPAGFAG